ncbi:MAG: hypothetical protein LBL21_01255 [Rickettsiales bacterium]|jgi:phosphohistidine swiveling domain-containing protein|nr:hypothetical protein [Rickettsiales bacterium]
MKKIFAIISALFIIPLYAEVAPVYEEEVIEEIEEADEPEAKPAAAPAPVQPVNPALSATRAATSVRGSGRQSGANSPSRAVSARAAVTPAVRGTATAQANAAGTRPISSRTAAIQNRGSIQSRAASRSRTLANAIAGGAETETSRASANQKRTVQARAGTLYNAARVGVSSNVSVSAGTRGTARAGVTTPTLFNSTGTTTAASSVASSEELAAQTDFCKAQYASCMDNFCNVLDDNQGRCTCSSSVAKYEKTEEALKQATIDLQDIATKIKYLGLSKDEVRSLFTQTAAEEEMQSQNDSSALKLSLDKIQKFLIDPTSATSTSGGVLTLDFSSFEFDNGFDMSSFLNTDSGSIKNQRGAALFETAQARCKNILTDCKKQEVDSSMVTAYYDLEIDKQCVSYERSLIDSNDQMKQTIRNATTVLQQARLMVAQNKNKYDLKGCVTALDSCMVDDFVCGDNYKNCLDITGKYIVGGDIVIGSTPGTGLEDNWVYGSSSTNAFGAGGSIADMIKSLLPGGGAVSSTDRNLASLLFNRIGEIDDSGRAVGMCSSVLNQCQNYTYKNNKYEKDNSVVKEYLARTLGGIRATQDGILVAYGESCKQDMVSCFTKNGATSARPGSDLTTAINACKTYTTTCASVNGMTTFGDDISVYVCKGSGNLDNTGKCKVKSADQVACESANDANWEGTSCKCASNDKIWSGSACVENPVKTACDAAGEIWNSIAIACDCTNSGETWNGAACS